MYDLIDHMQSEGGRSLNLTSVLQFFQGTRSGHVEPCHVMSSQPGQRCRVRAPVLYRGRASGTKDGPKEDGHEAEVLPQRAQIWRGKCDRMIFSICSWKEQGFPRNF